MKLTLGPLESNCYLIFNRNSCLIIDPGSESNKILEALGDYDLVAIVLTHGHFDHIGAVKDLVKKYHCPIYISPKDEILLHNPQYNYSYPNSITINHPVKLITEKILVIGDYSFQIFPTPGHTAGSITLRYHDYLFTGDTLFQNDVGRTDLYSGSEIELSRSLKLLKKLPKKLEVLPGHGPNSTIKAELLSNPYLRD